MDKFEKYNPTILPATIPTYKILFEKRLQDPLVGDRVEVSWQGKFRLEALEVYQGRAWWVADVVAKDMSLGYKIRYPGWDSRWDEWVLRSRLRWRVERNETAKLQANDSVELWCFGSNVPGAWLEARVKKVRGDSYCVGKVLSTGSLWVERDRLRPAKRAPEPMTQDYTIEESENTGHTFPVMLPTQFRNNLRSCAMM